METMPHTVTNSAFLYEIARGAPRGSWMWVNHFRGEPREDRPGIWGGEVYSAATMAAKINDWTDSNTYYSVAALQPDDHGEVKRRKTPHFLRLMVLVADDIALESVRGAVSYVITTSPGKHQVGILLDLDDDDCADAELCDALLKKMAVGGLISMDKSGNNVVRYVRLPVGQNQKPRESGPFAHELMIWAPNVRLSLEDAAATFGVDLDDVRADVRQPNQKKGESGSGAKKESQADKLKRCVQDILSGDAYHESLIETAASVIATGMHAGAAKNLLRALMEAVPESRRDNRWKIRYADIGRAVDTASAKFKPEQDAEGNETGDIEKPFDIFRRTVAPPIPHDVFPAALRDYAVQRALAAGHDPGAYLMACLGAISGAISDDVCLLVSDRTDWFERARTWVLLLGAPGAAKTPAIRAAVKPLHDLHRSLREQHERDQQSLPKDERTPSPVLYTNDPTIESLSEVLQANPRGVSVIYEELDSWIGAMDAYRGGQGGKDRGEWLRLYDGGPHQVDRIKRGSVFVRNWGVSILGATTPAGLNRHAKNLPTDGLLQRFLPVMVQQAKEPDMTQPAAVLVALRDAYEDSLRDAWGVASGTVHMAPDARVLFDKRVRQLRDEVDVLADISEPLSASWTKHAGMVARIALSFHVFANGRASCEVLLSAETMSASIKLVRCIGQHQRVMLESMYRTTTIDLARAIGRVLIANEWDEATRRMLTRGCRSFRDAEDWQRDAALAYLEDAAWLSPVVGGAQSRGRVSDYMVNPRVHTLFASAGKEQARRRKAFKDAVGGDEE